MQFNSSNCKIAGVQVQDAEKYLQKVVDDKVSKSWQPPAMWFGCGARDAVVRMQGNGKRAEGHNNGLWGHKKWL